MRFTFTHQKKSSLRGKISYLREIKNQWWLKNGDIYFKNDLDFSLSMMKDTSCSMNDTKGYCYVDDGRCSKFGGFFTDLSLECARNLCRSAKRKEASCECRILNHTTFRELLTLAIKTLLLSIRLQ